MTRDQAVTLLLSRLGNRPAAQYTAIILAEMDDIQQTKLEADPTLLPWFLITETSSASFTIGEERLEVPADFIQEVEEAALQVLNPDSGLWVNLLKDDYDNMDTEYADAEPGIPKAYALVGNYFRVRPVPDLAYSARMIYFGHQVLPSASNVENPWLKHAGDLLLAETAYSIASSTFQDTELAQVFVGDIKRAKDRLWKMTESRMHANRNYRMGDD